MIKFSLLWQYFAIIILRFWILTNLLLWFWKKYNLFWKMNEKDVVIWSTNLLNKHCWQMSLHSHVLLTAPICIPICQFNINFCHCQYSDNLTNNGRSWFIVQPTLQHFDIFTPSEDGEVDKLSRVSESTSSRSPSYTTYY